MEVIMARYLIPVGGEVFGVVNPAEKALQPGRKGADLRPAEERAEDG